VEPRDARERVLALEQRHTQLTAQLDDLQQRLARQRPRSPAYDALVAQLEVFRDDLARVEDELKAALRERRRPLGAPGQRPSSPQAGRTIWRPAQDWYRGRYGPLR
jgi:uncharacterized membrane protein